MEMTKEDKDVVLFTKVAEGDKVLFYSQRLQKQIVGEIKTIMNPDIPRGEVKYVIYAQGPIGTLVVSLRRDQFSRVFQ